MTRTISDEPDHRRSECPVWVFTPTSAADAYDRRDMHGWAAAVREGRVVQPCDVHEAPLYEAWRAGHFEPDHRCTAACKPDKPTRAKRRTTDGDPGPAPPPDLGDEPPPPPEVPYRADIDG